MNVKNTAVVAFAMIAGLLQSACPGPDPASNVVAEFTTGTTLVDFSWGHLASITCEVAQSFFVPANTSCSSVELRLGAPNGTLTGDYTVELHVDDGGEPSALSIPISISQSASADRFGGGLIPNSWNAWQFEEPVPLVAGQTYWIVCLTNESAAALASLVGDGTAGYADGFPMFRDNSGPWTQVFGADIFFRVLK